MSLALIANIYEGGEEEVTTEENNNIGVNGEDDDKVALVVLGEILNKIDDGKVIALEGEITDEEDYFYDAVDKGTEETGVQNGSLGRFENTFFNLSDQETTLISDGDEEISANGREDDEIDKEKGVDSADDVQDKRNEGDAKSVATVKVEEKEKRAKKKGKKKEEKDEMKVWGYYRQGKKFKRPSKEFHFVKTRGKVEDGKDFSQVPVVPVPSHRNENGTNEVNTEGEDEIGNDEMTNEVEKEQSSVIEFNEENSGDVEMDIADLEKALKKSVTSLVKPRGRKKKIRQNAPSPSRKSARQAKRKLEENKVFHDTKSPSAPGIGSESEEVSVTQKTNPDGADTPNILRKLLSKDDNDSENNCDEGSSVNDKEASDSKVTLTMSDSNPGKEPGSSQKDLRRSPRKRVRRGRNLTSEEVSSIKLIDSQAAPQKLIKAVDNNKKKQDLPGSSQPARIEAVKNAGVTPKPTKQREETRSPVEVRQNLLQIALKNLSPSPKGSHSSTNGTPTKVTKRKRGRPPVLTIRKYRQGRSSLRMRTRKTSIEPLSNQNEISEDKELNDEKNDTPSNLDSTIEAVASAEKNDSDELAGEKGTSKSNLDSSQDGEEDGNGLVSRKRGRKRTLELGRRPRRDRAISHSSKVTHSDIDAVVAAIPIPTPKVENKANEENSVSSDGQGQSKISEGSQGQRVEKGRVVRKRDRRPGSEWTRTRRRRRRLALTMPDKENLAETCDKINEKLFNCVFCEAVFTTGDDYIDHVVLHKTKSDPSSNAASEAIEKRRRLTNQNSSTPEEKLIARISDEQKQRDTSRVVRRSKIEARKTISRWSGQLYPHTKEPQTQTAGQEEAARNTPSPMRGNGPDVEMMNEPYQCDCEKEFETNEVLEEHKRKCVISRMMGMLKLLAAKHDIEFN